MTLPVAKVIGKTVITGIAAGTSMPAAGSPECIQYYTPNSSTYTNSRNSVSSYHVDGSFNRGVELGGAQAYKVVMQLADHLGVDPKAILDHASTLVTAQMPRNVVESADTGNHAHVPALVSQMNVHPTIKEDLLPALKSRGVLHAFATGTPDFPRLWLQVADFGSSYNGIEEALLTFLDKRTGALFAYEFTEVGEPIYCDDGRTPEDLLR